jgi:hypothetical protein
LQAVAVAVPTNTLLEVVFQAQVAVAVAIDALFLENHLVAELLLRPR